MDQDEVMRYVADTFAGVEIARPNEGPGAGDTFFIFDPDRNLEPRQQWPFATIVTKDYGDFDNRSQLDRPGAYRLNISVSRETFRAHFATSLDPGGGTFDFAALDRLMPHPVYAAQSWVSVLNPSPATFETVKPLLAEAYSTAVNRLSKRPVQYFAVRVERGGPWDWSRAARTSRLGRARPIYGRVGRRRLHSSAGPSSSTADADAARISPHADLDPESSPPWGAESDED